ncbi:MAG TPA: hypothetical protein VGO78_02525 [Acidimicrobiales bacterium]|nr:hypothetical protein [Acidimicrobiales bacterium]
MNRPSFKAALAAVAVATLLAAGCGDDDDDSATKADAGAADAADTGGGGAGADEAGYCDASLAIETAPEPEIDYETASEEEIATTMQEWTTDVMKPLADDVAAVAPAEIQDDVEVMMAAVDQTAAGDPSAFEVPDVDAASDRLHQFDLDTCGWTSQDVQATEYSFANIPDELPAGTTSFEFSNEGHEVHELMVVKKNDGVTDSAEALLALPQEEAMTKATILGSPAFAPPGDSDYKVVDLEPGEYFAACFIPMGMTSEDGPPPEGPPHFTQGMVAEFTVT